MPKFKKSKMTEKAKCFLGTLFLVWRTCTLQALLWGFMIDSNATISERREKAEVFKAGIFLGKISLGMQYE